MSKHKEFPEQADDLQSKRHFKECIITLAYIYWAPVPGTELGVLHRVLYLHLHNNQQDRNCGLLMSEEAETQIDQPMDSQLARGIAHYTTKVYRGL